MDEKFQYNRKFSTIYQGLATQNIWQMLFYAFFQIRRLLLSIILVQLEKYCSIQITIMCFLNIIYIIYFGGMKPLEGRSANRVELFGEVMNMLTCFNFFVFSDFLEDFETKFQWGFTTIAYITLLISANMLIIAHSYARSVIRKC